MRMTALTVLSTPEFHRLEGCLAGMSGLISQGQYNWYFDVRGFSGVDLLAEEFVTSVYPKINADNVKLVNCSFEEMVSEINHSLSQKRPMWRLPGQPVRYGPFFLLPREHQFWHLLKQCIDPETGRVFRLEANDHSTDLNWGISGGFNFVVINQQKSAGLIITAGNTD
jgi:hypothetical protein